MKTERQLIAERFEQAVNEAKELRKQFEAHCRALESTIKKLKTHARGESRPKHPGRRNKVKAAGPQGRAN